MTEDIEQGNSTNLSHVEVKFMKTRISEIETFEI